jgi:DNA-binding LacI/PurR family transcriptional regulator
MQSYDGIGECYPVHVGSYDANDADPASPHPPDAEGGGQPGRLAVREPRPSLPTMRDIASAARVSQSTVSRVLNDAPTTVPIAAETRERVLVAAKTLGYRPNPLARGLRGAPTMLLGAVVRDFSDPFFAGAIEALAVEAMARGYNVVLGHAHGRLTESIALTTVLETRHTDAIVLLGDMQDQPRLLADLRNSSVPVVALWQGVSPLEFPTVDVDDHAGMSAGLRHLFELGHERIALVSASLPGDNPVRRDAYVELMRDRFGGIPDGYVQQVPNTLAGGEAALHALVGLADIPTAIVASTDLVAVGVLHAAWSLGRTVPGELSVAGFDDILIAAHTVPPLTTLRMPMVEIVREGVRLAIDLARDPRASREPRVTRFDPTLVVRQSTAPPKG